LLKRPPFDVKMRLEDVVESCGAGNGFADIPVLDIQRRSLKMRAITIANVAPPTSVLAQGIGELDPEDGLMEVVCYAPTSLPNSISLLWEMLVAGLLRRRIARHDIFGWRTRRVTIECSPPQHVVVDGEIIGTTPVVFECAPASLRVFAPNKEEVRRQTSHIARVVRRLWRNVRGAMALALFVWGAKRIKMGKEIGIAKF